MTNPLFHAGKSDFSRTWEARFLDLTLVRLPWPLVKHPRWRYLYCLPLCLWWPPIKLEVSPFGWWLYLCGFVWKFG